MKKSVQVLWLAMTLIAASCTAQTKAATQMVTPTTANATITPSRTPTLTPTATAASSPTPTATPGIPLFTDDQLKTRVDALVNGFINRYHNPGVSVSVVMRNPQTGQLEAMLLNYGNMVKGQDQPVTSETVYEIGSITKVFTGILLAQKVNAGTMSLDDPIQKYMPDNVQAPQYKDKPIRLVDLATHRSGLPRDLDSDDPSTLYLWLDGFQPAHAPGEQYVYSNLGYMLLGDILSRLAQTDFNSLEFNSVSQPLGLMDTREVLTEDESERLAQGYTYDGSQARYFPESGAMSGAGYLRSTLQDMTRFLLDNMQPDSTPLADSIKLAQASQAEGRNPGTGTGLGWDIENLGAPDERIYKGGGTPGFTSYISFAADRSSGFVILTNGQMADSLAANLVQLLRQR